MLGSGTGHPHAGQHLLLHSNGSPSPIHLGTLGSWPGVQWGRGLEEKMLIGQGRWDQPSVLRRLQVRLLLPAQAERRPPEGDLRGGLLPPTMPGATPSTGAASLISLQKGRSEAGGVSG